MMHDAFMQKWTHFFFEGLIKLIVKIVEEHGFIWKLYRYCNHSFFTSM